MKLGIGDLYNRLSPSMNFVKIGAVMHTAGVNEFIPVLSIFLDRSG
jgi:hypothetical protein